jgi:hypothetical protein
MADNMALQTPQDAGVLPTPVLAPTDDATPTSSAQPSLPAMLPAPTAAPETAAAAAPTAQASAPVMLPAPVDAPETVKAQTLLPSPETAPSNETPSDKTVGILDTLNKELENFKTQYPKTYAAARVVAEPFIPPTPIPLSVTELRKDYPSIAGPGTFFGPETAAEHAEDINPDTSFSRKLKAAGSSFLDTSLIVPGNATDPVWAAAHPHEAAAAKGVSDVIQGLTSPTSLGIIVGTMGMGELPALFEKGLLATGIDGATAARAAKVSKLALQGLGIVFTADQISRVIESVPAVGAAILSGQTDKAIELATSAAVNGAVAGLAAHETRASILGSVNAAAESSAMRHSDYNDVVHKLQGEGTIQGSLVRQIAREAQDNQPDALKRQTLSHYLEAGEDRAVLRTRQAETEAGKTPSEQIAAAEAAKSGDLPFENYVYHVRDADETGVSHTEAPAALPTLDEAQKALVARTAAQGKPQEIVRIDLDKLKPADYTETPEGIKFTHDIPEHVVEPAPKPIPAEDLANPAAQYSLEVMAALKDAEAAKQDHVVTPEERAAMAAQQNPDFKLTPKETKSYQMIKNIMDFTKEEAQKRGLLPPGQVKQFYVPHELDFEDAADPTKRRLYDSIHELWQENLPVKDTDLYSLAAKYVPRMFDKIRSYDGVTDLLAGHTNEGAPLAVPGGFVEGQNVSTKGPQTSLLSDQEIQERTKNGQLPGLIKSGRVVQTDDGNLRWNVSDYKLANNLQEKRPIGPTPIPERVLDELKANGALNKLVEKNLIYQDKDGNYFNTEPLRARVQLYLHPDIADHMNTVVRPDALAKPTTFFGKAGKFYDDVSGNMKSLLFWGSPFHKVTEGARINEALFNAKGLKLSAESLIPFNTPDAIDYTHLTPMQEKFIFHGGVTGVDPRSGSSGLNLSEGLASPEGSWGAKLNSLVDRTLGAAVEKGLKTAGASDEMAHDVRRKIDLQRWLVDDVFGPRGTITYQKMAFFEDKYPKIQQQIRADHPEWTPAEVDKMAGDLAAAMSNNKFGGLNGVLLGRTLQDQRTLRRLLLAPDFLESTGRSVLDLGRKYNADLVTNLIKFNFLHLATAAGINLAIHSHQGDSLSDNVQNSHILDHPFSVVSPDGQKVYNFRSTMADFMHMVTKPRQFAYDRTAPILRSIQEILEQRNQFGRRESLFQAAKSLPKAGLPISFQGLLSKILPAELSLGAGSITEPTTGDQLLRTIGVQSRPARSEAEEMALNKVSEALQGTAARTPQQLVQERLQFGAEDKLRAALVAQKKSKDFVKGREDVATANSNINTLLQKHVITPDQAKKIREDAQTSRLAATFKRLGVEDSLDVFDAATDQERKDIAPQMQSKYVRWVEKKGKEGLNSNTMGAEDQKTLNRFREASRQISELSKSPSAQSNRPAQPSRPAQVSAERSSRPSTLPEPIPADTLPEPAPAPQVAAVLRPEELNPLVEKAAQRYGVDPGLVLAVIKQESAGDRFAVSNKGAHGLMQLLPKTARAYGVSDLYDAQSNIDGGTHYLSDLLKKYDGNERLALAAYNSGPTEVDRYGDVPPWPETQKYVETFTNR